MLKTVDVCCILVNSILKAFGSKKDTVSDISDVLLFSGIPDIVFNGI